MSSSVHDNNNKEINKSLYYNESDSFLFVDATKIYQLKTKDSEIKKYSSCLGNISKDFTIDNMKKKTGLKGSVILFSVDYRSISTNEILDVHKYLIKELV